MTDGFNWGLSPSGKRKDDEPADDTAATPAKADDPFAFLNDDEDDLPPTEAMPTPMRPYRPELEPHEPPAEPFVPPQPFWAERPVSQPEAPTPVEEPAPTFVYRPPVEQFRPPSQYPTSVAPAEPQPEAAESPELDDVFGEAAFREYDDALIPTQLPTRRERAERPGRPERPSGPRPPLTSTQRILIGVAAGLVAVLVLVLFYVIGTTLPGLAPKAAPVAAASSPAATATKTPTAVVPDGTLSPGTYGWDKLQGGECLEPFESAWADTYTVVDCTAGHTGQLVAKGTFDDATFPGPDALASETTTACQSAKLIDYTAAGGYTDLTVSASYATTQAEWDAGFRGYYCFVSGSDSELTVSLAKN